VATIGGGGNLGAHINAQFAKDLQRGDSPVAQNLRTNSGVAGQQKRSQGPKKGAGDESGVTLSDNARQQLKTESEHHASYVAEHGQELAQQSGLTQSEDANEQSELRQKRGYDRDQEALAEGEVPPGFVQVESPTGETQLISEADHAQLEMMDDPDITDNRVLDDIPDANLEAAQGVMDTQLAQGVSKVAALKSNPEVEAMTEVMEIEAAPPLAEPMDIVGPGSDKLSGPMPMEFPPEMEQVAAERAAAQLASGEEQEVFVAGMPGVTTTAALATPVPSAAAEKLPKDAAGNVFREGEDDTLVSSPDGKVRQQLLHDGSALTVIDHEGKTVPINLPPGAKAINVRQADGSYAKIDMPVADAGPAPGYFPQPGQVQEPVKPSLMQRIKYLFTGNPQHLGANQSYPPPSYMGGYNSQAYNFQQPPYAAPVQDPMMYYLAQQQQQAQMHTAMMSMMMMGGFSPWTAMFFNPMSMMSMFQGPSPAMWPPPFNPAQNYGMPIPQVQQVQQAHPGQAPPVRMDPIPQKPGSVVVVDQFGPTQNGVSPQGDVVCAALGDPAVQGELSCREAIGSRNSEWVAPNLNALTPQAVRGSLVGRLHQIREDGLRNTVDVLTELKDGGMKNSAINLSLGSGPAFEVSQQYDVLQRSWNGPANEMQASRQNLTMYAKALSLDETRLLHPDPKIHGPERTKLQQGLVDMSIEVDKQPGLAQAKEQYDKVVKELAAQKVSVVVSAGNHGGWAERHAGDRAGGSVKLPDGFYDNMLSSPDAVTVGGVFRDPNKPETLRVAENSNGSGNVSVYANSEVTVRQNGTTRYGGANTAAPRVASSLAALHAKYPDKSNKECLDMLLAQGCDTVPGPPDVPNLNPGKVTTLTQ
jgi:hypothetical protein